MEIRLLYAEEEETRPITNSKRIVFDVKKVFMLYSENIQYQDQNSFLYRLNWYNDMFVFYAATIIVHYLNSLFFSSPLLLLIVSVIIPAEK